MSWQLIVTNVENNWLSSLTLYCRRILTALAESLLAARWRQDLPSLSRHAGSPPSSISFVIKDVLSFLAQSGSTWRVSVSVWAVLPSTQQEDGVQTQLLLLQLLGQLQHLPPVSGINHIEDVLSLVGDVTQVPGEISSRPSVWCWCVIYSYFIGRNSLRN